jgi:hypothetical protein
MHQIELELVGYMMTITLYPENMGRTETWVIAMRFPLNDKTAGAGLRRRHPDVQ